MNQLDFNSDYALLDDPNVSEPLVFFHPKTGTWGLNRLHLFLLARQLVAAHESQLTVQETVKLLVQIYTARAREQNRYITPSTDNQYIPFQDGIWSYEDHQLLSPTDPLVRNLNLLDDQIIQTNFSDNTDSETEINSAALTGSKVANGASYDYSKLMADFLFNKNNLHDATNILCSNFELVNKSFDWLNQLSVFPICNVSLSDFNLAKEFKDFDQNTKLLVVKANNLEHTFSTTGLRRYLDILNDRFTITNFHHQLIRNSPRLIIITNSIVDPLFNDSNCPSKTRTIIAPSSIDLDEFEHNNYYSDNYLSNFAIYLLMHYQN